MHIRFGLTRFLPLTSLVIVAAALTPACGSNDAAFAPGGTGGNGGNGGTGGTGGGDPGACTVEGEPCAFRCDPALGCVECATDGDCGIAKPACVSGSCEECGSNADCPDPQTCYPLDHTCQPPCSTDQDCDGDAPLCDPDTKACVGCTTDADCPTGTPVCAPTTQQCVECATALDCGLAKPVCDAAAGECVECLIDSQCPAAAPTCADEHCVAEPNPTCVVGLVACGAECVDLSTDPQHCGGCDTVCGQSGACVSGQCVCGQGELDCGGPGCIDPSTDPQHCGGCNQPCDNGQSCVSGNCSCGNGLLACGGGPCTDPSVDPNHCGGCDGQCEDTQYCVTSKCTCKPGLTFVNGQCRDLLSDPQNCGGANQPCGGNTPLCENGDCVADCSGPFDKCGSACVNKDNNPLHCGDCNNACAADEVCNDGECTDWQVGLGCTSCPCGACTGDFCDCATYPGDSGLIVCLDTCG